MSGPRQTAQEAARDPYSPTFGQFQYSPEVDEPGLVPGTPKHAFRKHPSFGYARVDLMKAFDTSNKTAGKLDLSARSIDYHAGSISMMGPAFMRFLSVAKSIEDEVVDSMISAGKVPTEEEWAAIQKELYEPERNTMVNWIVQQTGEDLESVRLILAAMYDAAGTASEVAAAADAGALMVRHAKMNQVAREQQRMMDQIERRKQKQESEKFWRRFREKRREQFGGGGGSSEGTDEGDMVGSLAGIDTLRVRATAPQIAAPTAPAPQPAPVAAPQTATPSPAAGSFLMGLSPETRAIFEAMPKENPFGRNVRRRR
jgi:hypothetical protein